MGVSRPWWVRQPRGRAADAVVAGVVTVIIVAGTVVAAVVRGNPENMVSPVFTWTLMLLACGALFYRRRHPIPVAVFVMLACAFYYPMDGTDGPLMLAFLVVIYTLAVEGYLAAAVVLGVLSLLGIGYGEMDAATAGRDRHVDDSSIYLIAGWLVAVIALGAVVRNRQAYLREAERRIRAAERGREEEARRRASEERLRIAREVHDVVGHNISLINVQASAALHRIKKDPEQAESALAAIKESSGDALRELRTTLGVLRQVDEEAPTAPAPTLDRLDELVGQASANGLSVRTEIEGDRGAVPPEVDLAAYRIVQESLTNVRRHASAGTAVVRIRYGGEDVRVEIDDDGSGAPEPARVTPGNGIRGMTERAEALGGELRAGRRPQGGFRVHARLPIGGSR